MNSSQTKGSIGCKAHDVGKNIKFCRWREIPGAVSAARPVKS